MTKPKILVTRKISDTAEQHLKNNFDVTLNPKDVAISYENLAKTCNDYDGDIATSFDKFDKNFFNSMSGKLKIKIQ
jgi:glyoxylate reductase